MRIGRQLATTTRFNLLCIYINTVSNQYYRPGGCLTPVFNTKANFHCIDAYPVSTAIGDPDNTAGKIVLTKRRKTGENIRGNGRRPLYYQNSTVNVHMNRWAIWHGRNTDSSIIGAGTQKCMELKWGYLHMYLAGLTIKVNIFCVICKIIFAGTEKKPASCWPSNYRIEQ